MTTHDPKNPPAPPAPPDDKNHGESPPTMTDVKTMVVEVIDEKLAPILAKLGGGPADPASPGAPAEPAVTPETLSKLVDDAVAKVNAGQAANAEAEKHRQAHAAIEAAAAERVPVERPRRSAWLGNIWDR